MTTITDALASLRSHFQQALGLPSKISIVLLIIVLEELKLYFAWSGTSESTGSVCFTRGAI